MNGNSNACVSVPPRFAQVGDVGVVKGCEGMGGSGIAKFHLDVDSADVVVVGDWRPLRDAAADLMGRCVEVVQGDGSDYGMHCLRPVDGD